MKVICIDASRGFNSGLIPPFKENEICDVCKSPYRKNAYYVNGDRTHTWESKRFIPLSTIDENELAEQRDNQLQEL